VSADATGAPDGGAAARATWTSVRVQIVGDEYTLRSEAPEAHTRAVAEHVDRVIRQVLGTGTVVETHKAAILAALQIADELLRARADADALAERTEALAADVRRWLPPAKRGEGDG
jgi:cell division protein ZapA